MDNNKKKRKKDSHFADLRRTRNASLFKKVAVIQLSFDL